MRKFNPEKELSKIRNGNKKKVIISICALLVVGILGYSFALYQVRHTNKIVYTTVDKFINKDIILSVKLDDKDESANEFPTADSGYVYSHTECEKGNITDITWNEEQRSLNMNSKGPDKCTVYFVKSPFHMKSCENKSMAECLLEEGQKFTNILAFDDPDGNARYMGENSDNYIWFNCDDYGNLNQETAKEKCEKWRIVGSFKNMEKVNDDKTTTEQNLVKLIRSTDIGIIPWDNKGEFGLNDWTKSSLQINLNKEYLTENDDGSWIIREENIINNTYNNTTRSKDYKAITSNSLNKVEEVVWNIGGYKYGKLSEFYKDERGSVGAQAAPDTVTWNGKIALVYLSDVIYAIGKNIRESCFSMTPGELSSECKTDNWILPPTLWMRVLNPEQASGGTRTVSRNGYSGDHCAWGHLIYPSLYLTSDVYVESGNGTSEEPYIIKQISQ